MRPAATFIVILLQTRMDFGVPAQLKGTGHGEEEKRRKEKRRRGEDTIGRGGSDTFSMTWEESTNLKFLHRSHGPVDISVVFAEGEHGDSNPFDGPSITNAKGNVLAHAFFPRFGGELHFDEAEAWAPGKGVTGTVDLYMVAVHEIGHSLGLKHSSNRHAVMAEYYQQYTGNRIHLHEDDIRGMALLYGDKGTSFKHSGDRDHSLTITSEVAAPRPDICRHATVDGITRLGNGTLYAFRGAWYWKLREEGGIEEGWPRKIEDDWPFEAHIDEIMTDRDGDSYVFKGEQYWLLSPFGHLHHGYPKPIAGLKDMPPSIDAGFIWHGDDQPYFFKKERFWAFNPRDGMGRSWPRTIKQIFQYTDRRPDRIDAALMLNPNESFLFAGTKYWRTTNFRGNMTVVGNPRSIANYWFGCDHKKHLIK